MAGAAIFKIEKSWFHNTIWMIIDEIQYDAYVYTHK